jgi:hypothetical protein
MQLLRKGQAEPFPAGTRFKINGNPGEILRECPCTDGYLHYEVLFEGEKKAIVVLHSELVGEVNIS